MITKFKLFINESLSDFLKGPSEEEIWNNIKKMDNIDFFNNYTKIPTKYKKIADERLDEIFKFYKKDELLLVSIERGFFNGVKKAVELGADILYDNCYPFRRAVVKGYFDIVKYLVEKGSDIHADNDSVLFDSVYYGHTDILKYLVEQGLEIKQDVSFEDHELLFWAAQHGHLETVKYLIEQGADIYANDSSAYKVAKYMGFIETSEYLKSKMDEKKLTEGLNDYLKGPTHNEIIESLKDNPKKLLIYSINTEFKEGIELALKSGNKFLKNIQWVLNYPQIGQLVKIMNYSTDDIIKLLNNNEEIIFNYADVFNNKELYAYLLNNDYRLSNSTVNDLFYNRFYTFEYICKHVKNFSVSKLLIDEFIYKDELSNIKKVVDLGCFDIKWFGTTVLEKAIEYQNYDIINYFLEIGTDSNKIRSIYYTGANRKIKELLVSYGYKPKTD